MGSHHQVHATDRQSLDIPRNSGPIQLAAPPQSECISSSRIVPRPSASRRAATTREPPLSNHEELRFDEGSTQRAHWAGPSRAAPTSDEGQTCRLAHRRQLLDLTPNAVRCFPPTSGVSSFIRCKVSTNKLGTLSAISKKRQPTLANKWQRVTLPLGSLTAAPAPVAILLVVVLHRASVFGRDDIRHRL